MYINGSGRDYYEFFIQLNRCGTLGKNAIHEKSRENPTVNQPRSQLCFRTFINKNNFYLEFHVEHNHCPI